METTHENSRLKLQFLPSATATLPKNRERDYLVTEPKIQLSDVKKSHFTLNFSPLKIQERDYFLNQLKIQPIDTQPLITIQNGNSDFVQELKKINQLPIFDGFNCLDLVAVSGNNLKQERQNLFTTVLQHHTIVDVFLCLSFASCLFTGELRLALALVRLWWGGHGNKPFGANTVCRCCNGSEPPYRPTFRANNQNIITRQKGTTK